MSEPTIEDTLSPLDQIRQVEAEMTRKTIAARTRTDQRLADARAEATLLKKQARESGEQKGRIRYKQVIAEAETQTEMILAHAEEEAANLRRKGDARMERAIDEAVNIVLGRKAGGTRHEP
jgi:hypothetical protein